MASQRPKDRDPIDRWVQASLSQRYGATLREPLPEALLKLLGGDQG